MKVVLAEKPSVAREIAAFLGARSRGEGYLEGGGYRVTWALGHLVALKEPDEYEPTLKPWSLETLPFIPPQFELKLVPEKHARAQFAVVQRLFRAADEIICATDAGREGELIFRYVLTMAGCERKPVRRLWLSSLTPRAIDEAFRHLKPGAAYDDLYAAAKCRSEADWIVGMNGTRNYTVRFGAGGFLWSVGRVQTPVLALIVQRDDEIRTFRPEPFWELLTRYRDTLFKFAGERFRDQNAAERALEQVLGRPLRITEVDRKHERTPPPQLYDLTELQRDLNRRWGMSAAETLSAAQTLYERKLLTYPRTDSRYLTTDLKQEIPEILRKLRALRGADLEPLDLAALRFTRRIIDDRKVSDHHAIIPTGNLPESPGTAERRVFDAVVTRLIAAFYPPCEKEVTTVHAVSNDVPFRARGHRVLAAGWTALYPPAKSAVGQPAAGDKARDDNALDGQTQDGRTSDAPAHDEQADSQNQILPAFTSGEQGPHEPSIRQGETTPPKPYTENTLLGAMETAGRLVDDDQLRELLRQRGLGTPATRAAIIETLVKRNYVVRDKKTLSATDLGRYLIAVVENPELKSPELTGQWEAKLREIESGRLDPQQFMAEIAEYTRRIVACADRESVDESRWGDCPRCGRPVIQGRRGFGCSGWRDGCAFVLWPEYQGQPLSPADIRQLLQHHVLKRPVRTADGSDAILTLTATGCLTDVPLPRKSPTGGGVQRRWAQSGGPRGSKSVRGRQKPERRRSAGRPRVAESPGTHSSTAGPPVSKPSGAAARVPNAPAAAPAGAGVLGACPLCGAPVVERPQAFGCSVRDCRFVIWRTIAGKRITARTAKTLLDRGQTARLSGFQSKAGKPFSASLRLVDGQVKFVFD